MERKKSQNSGKVEIHGREAAEKKKNNKERGGEDNGKRNKNKNDDKREATALFLSSF